MYVEGKLQTRKWQDQNGQDRYSTEIKADRVQFLDRKGDRGGMEDGGMEEPAPRGAARSGGCRGGAGQQRRAPVRQQPDMDEDLGPAFPSEASNMDDIPF